ncbi:MAG TPA: cytochrome c peroxidase [Steroidobacteraceae bacterium]
MALATVVLGGCGGDGGGADSANETPPGTLSDAAQLGDKLFSDTKLSASGQQACSTCHVPSHAYTSGDGQSVPLGGAAMNFPGFRNAPSLVYTALTPGFTIVDGAPSGGFFRDGRASDLATQATQPFVNPFEMANTSAAEVVARLQTSQASLQAFIAVYGADVLNNQETALVDMGQAIAAYETEDPSFHPFSSKFDAWLAGTTQLSATEARGLALFNNPDKGNCTACHPSQRQEFSEQPLFTDFSYDNIGVPRNWKIAANTLNPLSPVDGAALTYIPLEPNVPQGSECGFYDLGLCGPFEPAPDDPHPRPILSGTTSACGQFKVPTLRNIALTAPYFHNGVFDTLKEVIEWYVTRDINNNPGNNPNPVAAGPGGNLYARSGSFYTAADGSSDQFEYNDLPVDFDANVNVGEVPYTPPTFAGGQSPTLTADDINAVIVFLCTLTDGFDSAHPSAYALPAQCQAANAAASQP